MHDTRRWIGVLLGLLSALLGGVWQVTTRHSTTTSLPADELVILRYVLPALLLAPLGWRSGLLPAGLPRWRLALLVVGGGLPFGWLAMSGSRLAPSAHMGVVMAGGFPLFTALLAWALWRERPDRLRAIGLLLMACGVALLGTASLRAWQPAHAAGDALFLLAAALWAGFTLTLRGSGLGPWQAAALVNTWSALGVLIWVLLRGGTRLFEAPLADLAWQVLWQGVLAGVVGLWSYTAAVARLGPAPAAAFGALTPAVATLGGWLWLGETAGPLAWAAVAATVLGVALASGVLSARRSVSAGPLHAD